MVSMTKSPRLDPALRQTNSLPFERKPIELSKIDGTKRECL
jgi:hypothetical protein